jgi:Ca2+-binding EF-hand superfamily protein
VILQVVDQLFEEYDTDKSGFLDSKELEVLVKIAIERTGQDPSCLD